MRKRAFIFLLPLILASCNQVLAPSEVNIINNKIEGNIHTVKQLEFINSTEKDSLIGLTSNENNDYPLPITFTWKEDNDINQEASYYSVNISENIDMSNSISYVSYSESIDIYNLKINTQYYYQIISNHSGKTFTSEINGFTIDEVAPRNIKVEGVSNTRDLGGYKVEGDKEIKQGMIYRSAQFNYGGGLNKFVSEPTNNGKNTLLSELKIKTEIDLRKTLIFNGHDEVNGISSSPLGNKVKYISAPMMFNNQNIFENEMNIPSIKLFFESLADINNYPVIFHCVRGTDRTGALAYLLGAILGMSEEDLMLDYLFSNLANIGNSVKSTSITSKDFYIEKIKNSTGETYSEKATNYLIEKVGLNINVVETIKSILLG